MLSWLDWELLKSEYLGDHTGIPMERNPLDATSAASPAGSRCLPVAPALVVMSCRLFVPCCATLCVFVGGGGGISRTVGGAAAAFLHLCRRPVPGLLDDLDESGPSRSRCGLRENGRHAAHRLADKILSGQPKSGSASSY